MEISWRSPSITSRAAGRSATERWVGKLSLARIVARQAVINKTVERIEIRNETGQLVFRYPQVTQSA
jgi:hypothetical protein